MDADLAQFLAPIRLITVLLTAFGLTGFLLAALGLFGTMSYTVSQRQREMAVRTALGADKWDIVRLVFKDAMVVTAAGMVAGIVGALLAARTLRSFLYQITPGDPLTLASVVILLTIVSIAACCPPAYVAASADPMTVLRRDW
jgi:putative ABC transport system permease protein